MPISHLMARLKRRLFESEPPLHGGRCALLIVVEGAHDVVFLKSLSRILHAAEEALPDLSLREQAGQLVFLPFAGGRALARAAARDAIAQFIMRAASAEFLLNRSLASERRKVFGRECQIS